MPPPVGTATRLKNMGTRRLVIGHIRLSPLIGDCFDVWGSAVGGVELGYRLFGERLQAVMAQPLAQAERWYGGPTRVGLVSLVRRQSLRWAQERHTAAQCISAHGCVVYDARIAAGYLRVLSTALWALARHNSGHAPSVQ
jgi:hypothetical protein